MVGSKLRVWPLPAPETKLLKAVFYALTIDERYIPALAFTNSENGPIATVTYRKAVTKEAGCLVEAITLKGLVAP